MTTTGGTGPRPGGTWAGEAVVTTCVIVALLPLVLLDAGAAGSVDPLRDVISDHVFQPGGYALLGVSALALAAASTAPAWRPAAPTLVWSAGITGAISTLFLLTHVPIVIAGSPGFPLIGGVQRVLWVAVMVMLVVTARATRLSADRAADLVAVPAAGPERPDRSLPDPSLRGAA